MQHFLTYTVHWLVIITASLCAGLTSSVTIGFVHGLRKGKRFGNLESVEQKLSMLKKNYRLSVWCMLGLAACGLNSTLLLCSKCTSLIAGAIAVLSGIMASTVAVQFYQFPNLLSSAMFPKSSSISLSLTHAVGMFTTAQMFAMNSRVLGRFGWSASWMFLAAIFGAGGKVMMNAIPTGLYQEQRNDEC